MVITEIWTKQEQWNIELESKMNEWRTATVITSTPNTMEWKKKNSHKTIFLEWFLLRHLANKRTHQPRMQTEQRLLELQPGPSCQGPGAAPCSIILPTTLQRQKNARSSQASNVSIDEPLLHSFQLSFLGSATKISVAYDPVASVSTASSAPYPSERRRRLKLRLYVQVNYRPSYCTCTSYKGGLWKTIKCSFKILTCMSQTKRPQPQIGCCVWDATQTVLNGVNGLVHKYFAKIKLGPKRRKNLQTVLQYWRSVEKRKEILRSNSHNRNENLYTF